MEVEDGLVVSQNLLLAHVGLKKCYCRQDIGTLYRLI